MFCILTTNILKKLKHMAMILICSLFTTSLANLFSSWPESKIGGETIIITVALEINVGWTEWSKTKLCVLNNSH